MLSSCSQENDITAFFRSRSSPYALARAFAWPLYAEVYVGVKAGLLYCIFVNILFKHTLRHSMTMKKKTSVGVSPPLLGSFVQLSRDFFPPNGIM